ncbi:MAG: hypothetical protein DMG88_05390 [Acidobacteria bacterium]|nr:MAG: hypothetical protein DMG88_05390 [Acidobacteriota bacterium]
MAEKSFTLHFTVPACPENWHRGARHDEALGGQQGPSWSVKGFSPTVVPFHRPRARDIKVGFLGVPMKARVIGYLGSLLLLAVFCSVSAVQVVAKPHPKDNPKTVRVPEGDAPTMLFITAATLGVALFAGRRMTKHQASR